MAEKSAGASLLSCCRKLLYVCEECRNNAPTERNVRKLNHLPLSIRVPIEADNPSIVRWEEKCIRCGMCKDACTNLMGVHGTYTFAETGGKASACIKCRQCENACPQHLKIVNALAKVAETYEG